MKRLLMVISLLLPACTLAQSLTIEAMHPQFDFAGAEPTTWTSAWFVTVDLPLVAGISFVGQLPFAHGNLKNSNIPIQKKETIGNPGIGLRFHREHLTIETMARLPIVENGFGGFVGALADIDRQEAFVPDIVALVGMIKTKIGGHPFSLHPYGGMSFNLKTQHERNEFFARVFKLREDDGEMFVLYGAEGWLEVRKLHLGAALNGRAWVSSGSNFDNSAIHQISAWAKLAFDHVSPQVRFRIPLDEILLDYAVGLNLELNL